MERVKALIDKLQYQKQQNEGIAQILVTVQLLHNELLALQNGHKILGSSKVAVVLPSMPNTNTITIDKKEHLFESVKYLQEEKIAQPQPVVEIAQPKEEVKPEIEQRPKVEPRREEYRLSKPLIEEVMHEPVAPVHSALFDSHADVFIAPTLVQQPTVPKEVHELIAEKRESLNDRLKQEKAELAHVLKDSPVKDLRKAIGINDKFSFINELFRGDEAMYERSIKTINGFNIYPEAEYWMNRELKVKLGWDDTKQLVQHFYHLVRRRFS